MPLIIKPRTLGLLHKVERRRDGGRFIVTVLAAFDLADSSRIDGEQGMWTMVAKAFPPGAPLDMGMPKPRAEVLIAGRLQAPDTDALLLEARIGGVHKRLAVFGDRWWTTDFGGQYVATEPRPIGDFLLAPTRAFGGPGHPTNAGGLGFGAVDQIGSGVPIPLPNIEDPSALIHFIEDQPAPAGFGPVDPLDPGRQQLAGTYDAAWARDVAPALADDIHPDFFMTAPRTQWLAGHLVGDEPYWLHNFSADTPLIEGRLPGIAPRAFIGHGDSLWSEASLTLDTVWFVAGARRGILVWHGVLPVADIEGKDVTDVMVAYERLGEEPRSIAHYAEVRRVRSDPETALRYAFSEWQLTPPRDPAEIERRKAARMVRAQEQSALWAEGMAFAMGRMMDRAGVPEALRPAPFPPPEPLLLPTPEELAEGDIDLGEMLDLVEEQSAKAAEEMRLRSERGQPVLDAMKALQDPDAGTAEVDALMAALVPLTGQDVAAQLDGSFAQSPSDLLEAAGVAPASEEFDAVLDQVTRAKDWRSQFVAGLKSGGDDVQLTEAMARFLKLPEASPLAAARAALDMLAETPMPPVPERPDGAAPGAASAGGSSVAGLLDALLGGDAPSGGGAEAEAAKVAKAKLAEAGQGMAAMLPGISVADPADFIDALLAEIVPADGPDGDSQGGTPGSAMTPEEARKQLDEAEVRLEAGVAELRLMAAKATYPEKLMAPRVSRRFGDAVLEHVRAGLPLAGRDLAGVDLAGADLSGLDLSGAFLERANLANARLRGANLSRAALTEARLDHADFTDADLTDANLSGVSGRNMRLDGVRLSSSLLLEACFAGASIRRAVFVGVRFIEVDLGGADLGEARLEEAVFIRVRAPGARFERATLQRCQILESDLTGACLDGAFLDRCSALKLTAPGLSAVRADVRGSAFIGGSQLSRLDFTDGLGSEASFFGADLTGAVFRRAICERTLFNEAQLAGADFHLATLRSALFDGTNLADADFAGAQLMEAQLHRAVLSHSTFRHANLFGADLSDTDLMAADFTGAHLVNSPLALETAHD
ncbi:DUF2169 family type VI secretion system accessory protein [Xanthobacter sediminis]